MKEIGFARSKEAGEWQPPARLRWSEDDARAMVAAFAASGLRPVAFARRHGLQVGRVHRWLAQLGAQERAAAAVAFAPVRLVQRAPEPRGGVEITVGNRIVRVGVGFCPETLRQVLAALDEAAC